MNAFTSGAKRLLTAWSFSRWKTYNTCAAQAKFRYVDKVAEPDSPAMDRGTEVHTQLAQYLRGDIEGPIPGWTYFEALFRQLRALNPLVEQEWGYNSKWGITGWFGSDTWFRSKLDAGAVYDDGTADIVDFKTGKPRPDETALQAELYALSVFVRYPNVTSVTVRFWYVDLEQAGKEVVYRFSKSMVPALLKKWTERGEKMLNDTIMAPTPGQHCKWCNFAKSAGGPCKYG